MRRWELKKLSFLAVSLVLSSIVNPTVAISSSEVHRRVLHQPLFPVDSPPSLPPPSPPPPDQPFFQESPNPPPAAVQTAPPPSNADSSAALPSATQPATKPAKKLAIAISVGIVTLGMLSALAFFLYRHRAKRPVESQKLVRRNAASASASADELRAPPSNLLYIGTMEPPPIRNSSAGDRSGENGTVLSPYHRLNSVKNLDHNRYRPSPELQPLPPLVNPALGRGGPASSAMSDEVGRDAATFYTPSVASSSNGNDDGFYTPVSRHSYRSNASSGTAPRPSVPHSKRTSPKSRLSASPDAKRESLPAPPPPPPPPHEPPSTPFYRRAKFSAPPPPPNLAILRSINNQSPKLTPVQAPPRPPPPPAAAGGTLSTPRKRERSESSAPSSGKTAVGVEEELSRSHASSERPEAEDGEGGAKPKLKPLHWDKVRATSDRATVWDQLKSSSFQLNEDMMESLFGCNSKNQVKKKEAIRKPVMPVADQENRVLDPKKSQNIAILLRALNVTRDEVTEALLDDNPDGLGPEFLETLVKMAPTKEEEIKLRDYNGDISKLGSAERFLKAVLDIPFAFKRVEAMLYRANFDTEVKYLRKSYQTLETASEELKNSRLFLKLLEAVLRAGNRMNVGTNRGDATSFKLDTLLKLADIKGTDGKTTLLHFVVQEIIRSEGTTTDPPNEKNVQSQTNTKDDFKKKGLQVVGGLSRELGDVKKAAGMDSAVLNGYVLKLELGLEKVRLVLQYEMPNMEGKFFDSMKVFLKEAEEEIVKVKTQERKALSHVKDATQYFHGDAAKEEAHPLRIFMIVRDFLNILDLVCKEVGRMQDGGALVGSARSFRISATASLPVLNRFNVQARQDESSDEEGLSS